MASEKQNRAKWALGIDRPSPGHPGGWTLVRCEPDGTFLVVAHGVGDPPYDPLPPEPRRLPPVRPARQRCTWCGAWRLTQDLRWVLSDYLGRRLICRERGMCLGARAP